MDLSFAPQGPLELPQRKLRAAPRVHPFLDRPRAKDTQDLLHTDGQHPNMKDEFER